MLQLSVGNSVFEEVIVADLTSFLLHSLITTKTMRLSLSILLLSIIHCVVVSQDQYDFEFSIESEAFDKDRKVYVHLPERYYEHPEEEFGVVYLLDGQGKSYYNNAKGIIDYLNWSSQIFPVIAVGIHSDNRGTEFIPLDRSKSDNDPDNNGQAHLLRTHLKDEVFPLLQEKFRISPFRAIVGHSRGGAFVANTLFSDEKDLFHAYISISPGMHYLNRQILNDAEEMITSEAEFHKFYYCTHGTVGSLEKYFKPQVEYLDSLFRQHPNSTIHWGKKEIEATSHWGCVAPSLVHGLLEMSRAYQVDQHLIDEFALSEKMTIKEQVANYYSNQLARLGFTIPASARDYHYYANQQTEYEDYHSAIEIYDLALELDPTNVRTLWNKSWALRSLERNDEVKKIYDQILELIDQEDSDISEERKANYKKNIASELAKM